MTDQKQQYSGNKNIAVFLLRDKVRKVTFKTDFDGANAKVVKQISDFSYRLQCINDCSKRGKPVNAKSWFFFSVEGFPKNAKGKFVVSKVQALISIYYSKYNKYYRPVYRVNRQSWKRLASECELTLSQNGEVECTIQYVFNQNETVQFAFCYPYQYQQNINYLSSLETFENDQEIYFHKEVLIQSPEKRQVHLLTITNRSRNGEKLEQEEMFDKNVFPDKKRPLKFRKPVVLITARVHPGQTPASYAMQGVINFLLNKDDLRAQILRTMFVFMVVPMINVDGVFHGHFRMDIHGKNLNRFYIKPDVELQPAIYGIKALARHLTASNRLSFYFDLHGHNAKKGCFIYGNAFTQFVQQVQSQVFCKLFAMNHSGFEYQYCNFSQKHMNAKDRFEDLTKQGCGRVVMHKQANIIHSYSLQCGILSANNSTVIPEPSNRQFKVGKKGFVSEPFQQPLYEGIKMADNSILFTEESYRNLGKNLLVSILDAFDKNPYNRVYNSRYKSIEMLRRLTAFEIFHSTQRFRMFQRSVFGKVKNINNLIQQILNSKVHYKGLYNCQFNQDQELYTTEWPKNVQGLLKNQKIQNLQKGKKVKSAFYEPKSLPLIEDEEEKPKNNILTKQIELSCIKLEEKHRGNNERKGNIKMDKTQTIQFTEAKVEENYENLLDGNDEILKTELRQKQKEANKRHMVIDKKSSDFTIHEAEVDLDSQSDQSQEKDAQLNQEILLMCENQREQNEIMTKIMHNNFDEKDYEQIEEKYKYKNHHENETLYNYQQLANTQFSQPKTENGHEPIKQFINSNLVKQNQNKYRVNRKVIINTCDISHQYQKKIDSQQEHHTGKNFSQYASLKRPTPAEEFRKNIYDAIKQEIKQGLKKEYDKRRQREKMNMKMLDSFKNKKQRARSNQNYIDHKKMKSKVKLPSLGSNMYIITTSTRVLQKS